jgi:HK97 family phage major capsid protein
MGIMNRAGLATAVARNAGATPPETNADAILRQITAIATTAYVYPDGVVMNPTNWFTVATSKDTTGQYFGGGPFSSLPTATLWGTPVAVTPSIVANTALVGAFGTMSQVFRKGGIRVEASNSHQDFFIKNLVAIRAEERLALAVYRPGAFGKVTGLI